MTSQGTDARAKRKELLVRHLDLEQNKDKAQGTLVSILFMTQITELKMLLDIGRRGHRFYDFVLALLIASIAMLIFVGMLIMYIGNIRYNRDRKRGGWRLRMKQCLLCRCYVQCGNQDRKRKRATSYMCVPIGVGAPDGAVMNDINGERPMDSDSESEDERGCCENCCRCRWPGNRDTDPADVDRLDTLIEACRVRVANTVSSIVTTTNRVEEVDDAIKKHPHDKDLQEESLRARADMQTARRDKEQAETEQHLLESQRQQAGLARDQREDKEERRTFKTVTFWQHFTTYLLYFICLMNIFITAFGIYGGKQMDEYTRGAQPVPGVTMAG